MRWRRNSVVEQLAFGFGRGRQIPVNPMAVYRASKRILRSYAPMVDAVVAGFALRRYCEDAALLEELRAQVRREVRARKREARRRGERLAGGPLLVFACTPE